MMSDHLCSMNETLSKQREEIDTLKLGNKVSSLMAPFATEILTLYNNSVLLSTHPAVTVSSCRTKSLTQIIQK